MGFNGNSENDICVGLAIEKYPVILALQTADMQAARIMEAETGNKSTFDESESTTQNQQPEQPQAKAHPKAKAKPKQEQDQEATIPDFDDSDFQEAPPLPTASNGGNG